MKHDSALGGLFDVETYESNLTPLRINRLERRLTSKVREESKTLSVSWLSPQTPDRSRTDRVFCRY